MGGGEWEIWGSDGERERFGAAVASGSSAGSARYEKGSGGGGLLFSRFGIWGKRRFYGLPGPGQNFRGRMH